MRAPARSARRRRLKLVIDRRAPETPKASEQLRIALSDELVEAAAYRFGRLLAQADSARRREVC